MEFFLEGPLVTFGPNHYVPILKTKRAEKAALRQLPLALRPRVTPLFEIVERTVEKAFEDHLKTVFKGLAESVTGYSRCFLDAREIEPDGSGAAAAAFSRAAAAGITFTPVTGVTRTVDVNAALCHRDPGLAVRLTRHEFEKGDLEIKLETFLDNHHIAANEIDLIVDLGAVESMIPAGVESLADAFLDEVPDHASWRTFTVSACAFPKSMGGVERHSHELVERADWIAWKDNLHGRRASLPRLPTFSDCAIQHVSGVEGFDPKTMAASASIRYARDRHWLLVKGESTRNSPPSHQFPQLAARLVYGPLEQHFAGPEHCVGCQSMKAAADGSPGLGSLETWRRLGTIHHISGVMQELGSLPWP